MASSFSEESEAVPLESSFLSNFFFFLNPLIGPISHSEWLIKPKKQKNAIDETEKPSMKRTHNIPQNRTQILQIW